jgi:hypothetical protein
VTDVDEHLYHPCLIPYLEDCKQRGVTYIPSLGIEIVTDSFPEPHEHLARTRTRGARTSFAPQRANALAVVA